MLKIRSNVINKIIPHHKVEQCLVTLQSNQNLTDMKTAILSFACSLILLLIACTTDTVIGPPGPIGPQGPKGADGESGFVFEWENINFTAPGYEVILVYPDNFEGLNSDVALVYLLWDSYTNSHDEVVEVWRPLSQTVLMENGTLIYNYDHSKYDVRLFLDATFPLDELGAIDTDAWVARVVVMPGSFWDSGRVDFSDYQAVEEALGLPKLELHRSVKSRR